MIIEQLISPVVPTLLPTDTGNKALLLMEENRVAQLPLVAEEQYMALIQENDVLDWNTPESQLSAAEFLTYKPAVFAGGHPYEALRIAHEQNLTVLPVIDSDNKYVGAITRDDLLKYIAENSSMEIPGGIIVLEIAPRSYTLYEIARICENEDVIITNVQVHTNAVGNLEVTLKTNRTDLEAVVSSFIRHEYEIKQVYGTKKDGDDTLDRYNQLMNFINM
jgi:acetoin utilization protein AcuB